MGLDGLLRARASVLSGILNGIDETVWDPAADPLSRRPSPPGTPRRQAPEQGGRCRSASGSTAILRRCCSAS